MRTARDSFLFLSRRFHHHPALLRVRVQSVPGVCRWRVLGHAHLPSSQKLGTKIITFKLRPERLRGGRTSSSRLVPPHADLESFVPRLGRKKRSEIKIVTFQLSVLRVRY